MSQLERGVMLHVTAGVRCDGACYSCSVLGLCKSHQECGVIVHVSAGMWCEGSYLS